MFGTDNSVPIYLQMAEKIKTDIISGKLSPGERLPSVRDLALQMKANPNTVQKSLAELEEIRLLYTERTNGKFVTENEELIKKIKEEFAHKIAEQYLSLMNNLGFGTDEASNYLKIIGGDKN